MERPNVEQMAIPWETLSREKDKLQLLVERSPFAVAIIDQEGIYTYVNPKFTELFGYTLEDVPTGRAWFEKAHPDPAHRKEILTSWIEDLRKYPVGEIQTRAYPVICKNGQEKLILFRTLTTEQGDHFITYEDITESRRAEETLRESEEKFRKIFNEIVTSGSEAGLHASAMTHKDISLFNQDLNRMNHPVNGVRFHFLLYDHQTTPFILDKAGIKYDSSLGFAEQFGFRNSFCFPFQPYDIRNDKPFDFYEIPLVLMDGTLQKYLSLSPLEAMNNLSDLILEIKRFKGCFTLLWHNTHFTEYKYAGWKEVFIQISELCKKENSLFLTCSGLVNTFQNE